MGFFKSYYYYFFHFFVLKKTTTSEIVQSQEENCGKLQSVRESSLHYRHSMVFTTRSKPDLFLLGLTWVIDDVIIARDNCQCPLPNPIQQNLVKWLLFLLRKICLPALIVIADAKTWHLIIIPQRVGEP